MKKFRRGVGVIGLLCIAVLFVFSLTTVAVAATISTDGGGGQGLAIGLTLSALFLLGMALATEPNYLSDVLLWEPDGQISRKKVTVLSGQNLLLGTVLGMITKSTPTTGTATEGNTGDGTCTGVTGGALAKIGSYILKCISVATGAITTPTTGTEGTSAGATTMTGVSAGAAVKAGTYNMVCIDATTGGSEIFQVTDPDGLLLPNATVAVAYVNAQINFTINDPGANAQVGDSFTVLASAADGDAGVFEVKSPTGEVLPPATVGVAYTNAQINFTLNDGDTDFIVGDTFTIAVVAGSLKVKILTPAAVDGSQYAYGVLTAAVDATSSDLPGVAIERLATLKSAGLVWPDAITDPQKATALAELEEKHIVTRTSA